MDSSFLGILSVSPAFKLVWNLVDVVSRKTTSFLSRPHILKIV